VYANGEHRIAAITLKSEHGGRHVNATDLTYSGTAKVAAVKTLPSGYYRVRLPSRPEYLTETGALNQESRRLGYRLVSYLELSAGEFEEMARGIPQLMERYNGRRWGRFNGVNCRGWPNTLLDTANRLQGGSYTAPFNTRTAFGSALITGEQSSPRSTRLPLSVSSNAEDGDPRSLTLH